MHYKVTSKSSITNHNHRHIIAHYWMVAGGPLITQNRVIREYLSFAFYLEIPFLRQSIIAFSILTMTNVPENPAFNNGPSHSQSLSILRKKQDMICAGIMV